MRVTKIQRDAEQRDVIVPSYHARLRGSLDLPRRSAAVVLLVGGTSSRDSRTRGTARLMHGAGIATLALDLLTPEEEAIDRYAASLRFNVDLLAARVVEASRWMMRQEALRGLTLGYCGAGAGVAAVLIAAGMLGNQVGAVVSRGGRPDLAGDMLGLVTAPTLLIVGERDATGLRINAAAQAALHSTTQLVVVPGATQRFEEPGALQQASHLAVSWSARNLQQGESAPVKTLK